jgi:transcriptional regulator with XRE-family HTH domain/Zn-dependent peptidase ImmA (M78 family)
MTDILTAIFGSESRGDSFEERARSSVRTFVRGQDQLAEWSAGATGHRLTAWEALHDHGRDKLLEIASRGAAILCDTPLTTGRNLRERRNALGLDIGDIASRAGLPSADVVDAEEGRRRVPIQRIERIARVLGLDERIVASSNAGASSEQLAVRLRTLGQGTSPLTASAVLMLAEAYWVGVTQLRLETWLRTRPQLSPRFNPTEIYSDHPAYDQGYRLALETRNILGFGTEPIPRSVRSVCEDDLGIPVVQASLPKRIAGATIATGLDGDRVVVVNINGWNQNVWVRRSTYAHELCHLLWDPPGRLRDLRVDDYDDLLSKPDDLHDPVEQRSNAFSVEFIAPGLSALAYYQGSGHPSIRAVMEHFGVSFTAARFQVWNASKRRIDLDTLTASNKDPDQSSVASESYTLDYFPLPETPLTRRGRFAAAVVWAAEFGFISYDTASEYLYATESAVRASAQDIKDLFPGLRPKATSPLPAVSDSNAG